MTSYSCQIQRFWRSAAIMNRQPQSGRTRAAKLVFAASPSLTVMSQHLQPALPGPHGISMQRGMGRGALISSLSHFALILAAIITVHTITASQQDSGTMVNIIGLSQYGAGGANGAQSKLPPAKDGVAPSKMPPNHLARESTPPMPTPPPLTAHAPPRARPLATIQPPPPTTTETPASAHLPPPRQHLPHPSNSTIDPPKTSLPVKPILSSAPDSATHQPRIAKTSDPFSPSLQATIAALRMAQIRDTAPTHPYAATLSGAQKAAGNPISSTNTGLNAAERNAIGQHVRPCFQVDDDALGLASLNVNLLVSTDPAGVVRNAVVAPQDIGKMSNPSFYAFAQRAIDAVMNNNCASLPLPSTMLGKNQTLLFDFSP